MSTQFNLNTNPTIQEQLSAIGRSLVYLITLSCIGSAIFPFLKPFSLYGKVEQHTKIKHLPSWLYVPKSWFIFYYFLSLQCCLLSWFLRPANEKKLFLFLITIQSARRLVECAVAERTSNSSSRMLVFHLVAGIIFYLTLQTIVWEPITDEYDLQTSIGSIVLFTICTYYQIKAHWYLRHLKKYSLPTSPMFKVIACPHYLAEIGIYVSCLWLMPSSSTMRICLIWVIVSLSVSALNTKQYYVDKYGPQRAPKYALIPGIY